MSNEKFIEESKKLFKTMNKEDEFRLFHPDEKTKLKVNLNDKTIEVVK